MTNTPFVSLFTYIRDNFESTTPLFRTSKPALVDLSHSLEDLVLHNSLPSLLFTGFEKDVYWSQEVERYTALSEFAQRICVFARGAFWVPNERHIDIHLTDDDPLQQEWFVLVLTEQFSALLSSREQRDTPSAEPLRTFDTIFTLAPSVIQPCVELLLNIVARYAPEQADSLRQVCNQFAPVPSQGDYMTKLVAILMKYAQERQDELQEAFEAQQQLRMNQDRLQQMFVEIAVPVVPLVPGVLVMPLVGTMDSYRSQQVMETLLNGIATHQADVAILDITGVPVVDTSVANSLIQTVQAARLLGTEIILTGIGADIAQTLVHLGVDFSRIQTCANLQAGIEAALATQGLKITPVKRET